VLGERIRRIRSHGRRKHRVPVWAIALMVLGLVAVGAGLRVLPGSPFAPGAQSNTADAGPDAEPTPSPTPPPLPFRYAEINPAIVKTQGFLSWALMDRRTGEIVGSANMTETNTTASMIKGWLASDYLRRAGEKNETPAKSRLADLEIMIRDSNNDAASRTYNLNGKAASIQRLISICKLTDSKTGESWGDTLVSARDAVRMGECIADGTAAGPKWTSWVLDMMRKVRDVGDFGIRKALPTATQPTIAIKNGWDQWAADNTYRTNCLAIGETWVMSVLQRYPRQGDYNADFAHTEQVCQDVATALLNPEAQ